MLATKDLDSARHNIEQYREKDPRLDKWKTELLVKIKNQIEEADNEFS